MFLLKIDHRGSSGFTKKCRGSLELDFFQCKNEPFKIVEAQKDATCYFASLVFSVFLRRFSFPGTQHYLGNLFKVLV